MMQSTLALLRHCSDSGRLNQKRRIFLRREPDRKTLKRLIIKSRATSTPRNSFRARGHSACNVARLLVISLGSSRPPAVLGHCLQLYPYSENNHQRSLIVFVHILSPLLLFWLISQHDHHGTYGAHQRSARALPASP